MASAELMTLPYPASSPSRAPAGRPAGAGRPAHSRLAAAAPPAAASARGARPRSAPAPARPHLYRPGRACCHRRRRPRRRPRQLRRPQLRKHEAELGDQRCTLWQRCTTLKECNRAFNRYTVYSKSQYPCIICQHQRWPMQIDFTGCASMLSGSQVELTVTRSQVTFGQRVEPCVRCLRVLELDVGALHAHALPYAQ